ncbi:hypothetical protein [Hymenobacter rubidus]|uniref:hypothetical protein n=1 Tax=Hymenobacter rubidus TaxID=1441626 RepID=UPI00191E6190|nr:hypothetical protein [Hymenobacter rubidus]
MKKLLGLIFFCTITNQLLAQAYQAKNSMRTRVIPVPDAAVRKFKKNYPKAQIDSCYVYGGDANPEGEFMFYSMQNNRVVNASYDRDGKPVELKLEIPIEELPKPTQNIIAQNGVNAQGVGRAYKEITWFPKQIRANRRRKKMKTMKVEYMVEFAADYKGEKLTVPMYFNESGYQANPGFR